MAFDIKLDKQEQEQFEKIMALYPKHSFVVYQETDEHFHIKFLGEDMEKDALLQEAFLEHLDSVQIEENIGKNE